MGVSFSELVVILLIVLILFGPGKLPEIGKALGRGIREFKKAQNSRTDDEDEDEEKQRSSDNQQDCKNSKN